MQRHFEMELEGLKTNLIKMASVVEEAVGSALKAFLEQDKQLAKQIIEGDKRINSLEIEIDFAIIDLLALQQPVAVDLRLILAAQKINNDLERIGDHAVNIAESALTIAQTDVQEPMLNIPKMCALAQHMLRDAIDSFIHNDPKLAQSVLDRDDIMDDMNRKTAKDVIAVMKDSCEMMEGCLHLMRISHNLERVADLATNIAEEVIFIKEARSVKHGANKL